MRVKLNAGEVEIRVQERRVVIASAYHKGKLIVEKLAIQAPQDEFNLEEGQKIAVGRVAQALEEAQEDYLKIAKERISEILKKAGALAANITLPKVVRSSVIVEQIMGRLRKRNLPDNTEAPSGIPHCGVMSTDTGDGKGLQICTKPKNHSGSHASHGASNKIPIRIWPQSPQSPRVN